ncbi:MAG TPA: isoprenyl transferase [Phycisphaerales bacterium]|nr:isoprenyl transferase [Phycisphaerales bacterium]
MSNSDFEKKRSETSERLGIEASKFPKHIAIIMDGNGRWATSRGLPRFQGHRKGARATEKIVDYCNKIGLECLTIYSFSMQNWKRPKTEIAFLMQLYTHYLVGIRKTLLESNVRLVHLGRTEKLPTRLVKELHKTIEITSKCTGMVLGLALNYGGREEIIDAMKKISDEYKKGTITADQIDEELVNENLYTAGLPDPDLLIRTSSEKRISNFLLWQLSYAEFYITDTLWPDFSPEEVDKAILEFTKRSRRLGDIKPSLV